MTTPEHASVRETAETKRFVSSRKENQDPAGSSSLSIVSLSNSVDISVIFHAAFSDAIVNPLRDTWIFTSMFDLKRKLLWTT